MGALRPLTSHRGRRTRPAVGIVVAIATLIEPAWVGSPSRPWVAWAIPVAVLGLVVLAVVG